ncbi:hypothetical protein NF867_13675 [Solitalea sp. MAHUQ-68]|uniref:Outer membrane protein beta-barrel domain-containing protein n=1 Tax=Solitalea agri TaxID=2953739 RepID=A0A9X2F360_9SPHI|nr:hypothetical protein [Solitalea agri]MCO4293909.1 hypothetical protein [Solitalea agri]
MKKTLLSIFMLTFTLFTYAQSTQTETIVSEPEETLKATAKNFATELNVNPFSGQLSLNNAVNLIKVRYFKSPELALRLGLIANSTGTNDDYNNPYGTNSNFYKNETSSTTLGLNFGLEKHFKGTRRLSPYIGADLTLSNKSTKQEITNGGTTTTRTGGWISTVYNPETGNYTTQTTERGYFKYGLNVLTGFDFYLASHFYFGYEFNFGFTKTDYQKMKETQTGTGTSNPGYQPNTSSSNFSFGSNMTNGIRLGYIF